MISKKDLLIELDDLTDQVFLQGQQINELKEEIEKIKPCKCNKNNTKVEKKPGRPRKER